MNWYHKMILAIPVVCMVGGVLPGCTGDTCATEEEKAAAKENGTELLQGDDCFAAGVNQKNSSDLKPERKTTPSTRPGVVEGPLPCCQTKACICDEPSKDQ